MYFPLGTAQLSPLFSVTAHIRRGQAPNRKTHLNVKRSCFFATNAAAKHFYRVLRSVTYKKFLSIIQMGGLESQFNV